VLLHAARNPTTPGPLSATSEPFQQGFVSGHGFSRAVKAQNNWGFSPCESSFPLSSQSRQGEKFPHARVSHFPAPCQQRLAHNIVLKIQLGLLVFFEKVQKEIREIARIQLTGMVWSRSGNVVAANQGDAMLHGNFAWLGQLAVATAFRSEISLGRSGGVNNFKFLVADDNVLGTGKSLTAERLSDIDRTSTLVRYQDPAVWGSHWEAGGSPRRPRASHSASRPPPHSSSPRISFATAPR